jgi:hypothetical protein
MSGTDHDGAASAGGDAWTWREGLRLRTAADTEGETQRLLEKLEAQGLTNVITRLVANSSSGFRPFVLMASALMGRASLPAADREAVILDIAARSALEYEWFEHESIARRVGLTGEQIEALRSGDWTDASVFTGTQLLAMRITRALLDGQVPGDDLWEEAVTAWGQEGALELLLSVAWWGGYVPVVIRGLGLLPASRAG